MSDRIGPERIGAYLARQRELRGIALEDLARQTRIPLRSLQRLEGGAFDHEPDGFARGFVRTVAIALGLPPDETIARMLPEVDGGDGGRAGGLGGPVRAVAAAALLGALAASLWLWLGRDAGQAVAPVFQAREDGLVVRRDAVRALAAEHGLLLDGASAPLLTPERPEGGNGAPSAGGEGAAAPRPLLPSDGG